jgi:DNA-binding NarL/FixJ family response regulator
MPDPDQVVRPPTDLTGRVLRVLVADDQPLMRSGFRLILEGQPDIDVVGEARDGEEAVAEARRLRPDVVLMDVRMPRLDGIEATRRIRGEAAPDVHVLVLTMVDLDEYVYGALQAGASGFLLKDVSPEHLVMGIRLVAAGDQLLAPAITRRLVERYTQRPAAPSTGSNEALGRLTPREHEVVEHVARGRTNAQIAEALVISEATVKTHVANILAKLAVHDRVQIVVFAYEQGVVKASERAGPRDPE